MDIQRIAEALRRVIPDPFTTALALTLLALAVAWVAGDRPLPALVEAWAAGATGFWSYLAFAMQMCLILVTGFAVASTRPARWAIGRLAGLPRTTGQATAMVAVVAMGLALLNWGLGLVAGALLAREVGLAMQVDGRPVHYPLLGAAGYTGLCVWHGGLSGSAPLKVTQVSDLVEVLGPDLAAAAGAIPLTRTVLAPRNLAITAALLVVVPLVLSACVPRDPSRFVAPPTPRPRPPPPPPAPGLAGHLDRGPWLVWPFALLMAAWIAPWILGGGFTRMGPNEMNFVFLALGLVLVGSPLRYMELATEGARACAGIIVQFPFYAGIRGLLVAGGLTSMLAAALPASPAGLLAGTFLSAGTLNLFIPSGGGQWGVQGPVVIQAALEAGVDPARVVMAFAYGDQWTNLFQPFWALPLLGITGSRAGDILGYTAILGTVVGLVLAVGVVSG